jgi:hypothetical protein
MLLFDFVCNERSKCFVNSTRNYAHDAVWNSVVQSATIFIANFVWQPVDTSVWGLFTTVDAHMRNYVLPFTD